MRRLLLTVLAAGLVLGGCGDDAERSSAEPGPSTAVTTTTTPAPGSSVMVVDDTFAVEDVDALCADLGALADIDPAQDPTAADVDRLRAIAETAPPGVAEPLRAVADYGQAIVDGSDGGGTRDAAVDGAIILIAYGNEVCDIDVPLFNSIVGV